MRQFRAAIIAASTLALSVGAVSAATPTASPPASMPTAAAAGLARAAAASGHLVPVARGRVNTAPLAPTVTTAEAPTTNHGSVVSVAAQAKGADGKPLVPDGFANHGAYVSSIARQNHGHTSHKPSK